MGHRGRQPRLVADGRPAGRNWLEVERVAHNLGKIHDAPEVTFQLTWKDGREAAASAKVLRTETLKIPGASSARPASARTSPTSSSAACPACGRRRRPDHLGALGRAQDAEAHPHGVPRVLRWARDAIPSIVEITDFLQAENRRSGVQSSPASSTSTSGTPRGRLRHQEQARHAAEDGADRDIVGEDDSAVGRATSRWCASPPCAAARASSPPARTRARSSGSTARAPPRSRSHQRVQDQRGRRDPAAAPRRLTDRRDRADQHRAFHQEQAAAGRRAAGVLPGESPARPATPTSTSCRARKCSATACRAAGAARRGARALAGLRCRG